MKNRIRALAESGSVNREGMRRYVDPESRTMAGKIHRGCLSRTIILPATWLPRPELTRKDARTIAAVTAGGPITRPLLLISRISSVMYPIPRQLK